MPLGRSAHRSPYRLGDSRLAWRHAVNLAFLTGSETGACNSTLLILHDLAMRASELQELWQVWACAKLNTALKHDENRPDHWHHRPGRLLPG
jgi:hypothetical protein